MTEEITPYGKQPSDTVHRNKTRLNSLVELMTGVVISSKEDFKLSVGHILQGALKHQFLKTFLDEIDSYRDKGRIEDEDFQTKQGQACFMEMLNFLDEDNPDDIRFEFMKKLYLGIMSDDERDRNSALEQQYLNLCRNLSAGELMMLTGAWKKYKNEGKLKFYLSREYYQQAADLSGLKHPALAEYHGKMLEDKGLLEYQIVDVGRTRKVGGPSTLAIEILKYIESYDQNVAADAQPN